MVNPMQLSKKSKGMKLVVISAAPIVILENKPYLYAPYENEMRLWAKNASSIQFCCPIWTNDNKLLVSPISFLIEHTVPLHEFHVKTFSNQLKAVPFMFWNFLKILHAMYHADHIHLRCPGNMGLLGAMAQVFFPNKKKTAKYAGNWDPKSKQPFSYKLQQKILSNTFLTRNMQVLVYGEWENQTKNIKPFFTATYHNAERKPYNPRPKNTPIKLLFVGTLSAGKQPLYAIQLAEALHKKGIACQLELYGEGNLRPALQQYCTTHQLENFVFLKGNQDKETVQLAYQSHHFMLLPSQSEGWPKVVAEAMFWGCVPVTTPVSCVPYMLAQGKRGLLLQMDLATDTAQLQNLIEDPTTYEQLAQNALNWSQNYTVEKFEKEIGGVIGSRQ